MLRFFSAGVIDQAVLSATNFAVGLLLLRRTDDADYGLFVLATTSLALLVGAQGAAVSGPMSVLAPKRTEAEKLVMASSLVRLLLLFWLPVAALGALVFGFGERLGLGGAAASVGLAGAVAAVGVLMREAIRVLWMLYSLPRQLLGFDLLFAVVYLGAALVLSAGFRPAAPYVVLGLGAASAMAALLAWRHFARRIGWRADAIGASFRDAWRLGRWALAGSVITWMHSQGFYYVVTALRGVEAVSALAAARLLLMPVNLMITGVAQLLLPMGSRWLHEQGPGRLLRNLAILSTAVTAAAGVYFGLLWLVREWVFSVILKRDATQLDLPLLLWAGVFGLTCLRSFAMIALQALERFDRITYLAALSTTVSLGVGYWGILHHQAPGALIGLICGELVDLCGIVWLTRRELRRSPPAPG